MKKLTVVHKFSDGSVTHQTLSQARRMQLSALLHSYRVHGDHERFLDDLEILMEGWESMLRKVSAKPGAVARGKSAETPAWLTMLFRTVYGARMAMGYKRVGYKMLVGEARQEIENNKAAYPDWQACKKAVTRNRACRFLEPQR